MSRATLCNTVFHIHAFIYCKKQDNVHASKRKPREVNQDYDVECRILGHPVVFFFSHNKINIKKLLKAIINAGAAWIFKIKSKLQYGNSMYLINKYMCCVWECSYTRAAHYPLVFVVNAALWNHFWMNSEFRSIWRAFGNTTCSNHLPILVMISAYQQKSSFKSVNKCWMV